MTLARRCLVLALAALAAAAAFAPQAQAAEGDPFVRACRTGVNSAPISGCVPNVRGRTVGAAMSPDGRQLYVSQYEGATGEFTGIQQYNRDTNTGALSQPANRCLSAAAFEDCTTVAGLNYAYDMRFSPDGRTLYVASFNNLWVFNRNTTTGALNQVGDCFGSGTGCTPLTANDTAYGVVATNSHVYLRGSSHLTVFERQGTGALTQGACYVETADPPCVDVVGLAGDSYKPEVSPDGRHLYTTFTSPGGISTFRIDGDELDQDQGTLGGCISSNGQSGGAGSSCIDGSDSLSSAYVAEIDPSSGGSVYVGGPSGVIVYSRNAGDGELAQLQCLTENAVTGCSDVTGVGFTFDMEVTPNGSDLIGATFSTTALAFFRRASNGTLTQRSGTAGCMSHGGTGGECQVTPQLGGIGRVEVASNSRHFYPTGEQDGLVGTFERDFAPTCGNKGASTGHNTPVTVSIACSDPNGDPLTYAITRAPGSGLVGAIDQGAASVVYSPNSGFSGGDSFQFRASARGVNSNVATANVGVAAAPTPPPPPPPPPARLSVVNSSTTFSSLTFAKYTLFTKLRARRLKANSTVRVTCKTKARRLRKRCPRAKTYRVARARKALNLAKPFKNKKLPHGTKVTIEFNAAGFRGKRIIYTTRKGKDPGRRVQCLNTAGKPGSCL